MKLLKKVPVLEVKRTFVIGNDIRIHKNGRRFMGKVSVEEFRNKLQKSKRRGLKMTSKQLDKLITPEWSTRLNSYEECDWYIGEAKTSELGVWRRAGDLPLSWTNGSLKDTADKVRRAITTNSKSLNSRARRAITNMLATNVELLQSEKYLLPIIFKGGTGTRGRSRLKRVMQGDIDDGCMRSIALAVSGVKTIRAYIGFPKKIRRVH
jgi:hypothetical protein